MRIYEGSPRQDFEEVLRSIGAILDARALRECLLLEVPEGFIVQGMSTEAETGSLRRSGPHDCNHLPIIIRSAPSVANAARRREG